MSRRTVRVAAAACLVPLLARDCRAASWLPSSPFSDRAAGTTSAAFLRIPPGARAQALGGAYSAAADDSEALFWNPAGLSRLEETERPRPDLSLGYSALLEDSKSGSLAYAHPLSKRNGVLAVGLQYFSAGSVSGFDAVGNAQPSFTPHDLALSAAYARALRGLRLGAVVKLIRSSVADASGTGVAADLGVQGRFPAELGQTPVDFGASVRQLGPRMKLGGGSDPLPLVIQAGVQWHAHPRVNAFLDGFLPVDQAPYPGIGVEGFLPLSRSSKASLRAGYNGGNTRGVEGLAGLSAGFGFALDGLRVDYAWLPYGDLGSTNRVSIGYRF